MLPFGLTERLFFSGVSSLAGCVCLVVALISLFRRKTYLDVETKAVIETEISLPFGVKFKTNGPAITIFIVGGILVGVPTVPYLREQPKFTVSGRIVFQDGQGVAGVPVGVLPGSHMTWTKSDGKYSLTIPRNQEGETYNGITFFAGSNPPGFYTATVTFDQNGRGTFDHAFRGRR